MSPARVDVWIPTRGRPAWCVEAVESVLAQTGVDARAVVAADGAQPELEALLAARADARVTFVASAAPRGRSAARNLAASASAAPFVAFLDDDDRLLDERSLAVRVDALEATPAAVLAYGRAVATDAEGRVREGARGAKATRARVRDGLSDQLRGRSLLPSTVCLRRSAFDAAGGFDEDLATGEDWLLFLRAARLGRFVDVGRPVVLYRRHGGQARGTPAEQEAALAVWMPRFFDDPATPASARAHARRLRGRHLHWISRNYRHAGAAADARRTFRAAVRDDPSLLLHPKRLARFVAALVGR